MDERGLIDKEILEKMIQGSPVCQHAVRELAAGYSPDKEGPTGWMYRQVMEAVALFSSHGNSFGSAPVEIGLVRRLCAGDVLTPLTFADGGGTAQNTRRSSVFRDRRGRIYDLRLYTCMPVMSYSRADGRETPVEGPCWFGQIFETDMDGVFTGRALRKVLVTATPRRRRRSRLRAVSTGAPASSAAGRRGHETVLHKRGGRHSRRRDG